jgi:hypothetical protein
MFGLLLLSVFEPFGSSFVPGALGCPVVFVHLGRQVHGLGCGDPVFITNVETSDLSTLDEFIDNFPCFVVVVGVNLFEDILDYSSLEGEEVGVDFGGFDEPKIKYLAKTWP